MKSPLTPELYCTNIENSINFYKNILGFAIQYERQEDGFVMLEREGARIMLEQLPQQLATSTKRTWVTAPFEHPFGRGVNFEIQTRNVDQLYQHVIQQDTKIYLALEEKWYRANQVELGVKQFIILDPDGYMLRFSQCIGERALKNISADFPSK